jgi:hypothetical protein
VSLAPSKMLRNAPLITAPLPLPFDNEYGNGIDYERRSYDVPWKYIAEETIPDSLIDLFKFIYIKKTCSACEKTEYIPYLIPRRLHRLNHNMIVTGLNLPFHVCEKVGGLAPVHAALPSFRIKKSWGKPDRKECKYIEIWEDYEDEYMFRMLNYMGTEEDKGFWVKIKDSATINGEFKTHMIPPSRISMVTKSSLNTFKVRAYNFQRDNTTHFDIIIRVEDVVAAYYLSEITDNITKSRPTQIPAHYYFVNVTNIDLHKKNQEIQEAYYERGEDRWKTDI